VQGRYDRTAEDVGNVVALEHVNVAVPDQRLATLFYIVGMGFTRDPYLQVGDDNMWVNVGRQQFHLPTRGRQVLRGHIGVVVPDLAALARRLAALRERLAGTRFALEQAHEHIVATCPWGNVLRCHAPGPRFGAMRLGIPYVELAVARGTAAGIARFYRRVLGAPASLEGEGAARVRVGPNQWLLFRETDGELPAYDGHHVAIYVADFSGPHRFLAERGLVSEDSDAHQYRFRRIVDPQDGAPLYELEHEVRSLHHPMWGRALVNRNPDQTQRGYVPDGDLFWGAAG
jgi:catechol-2,3-dioxygenase